MTIIVDKSDSCHLLDKSVNILWASSSDISSEDLTHDATSVQQLFGKDGAH